MLNTWTDFCQQRQWLDVIEETKKTKMARDKQKKEAALKLAEQQNSASLQQEEDLNRKQTLKMAACFHCEQFLLIATMVSKIVCCRCLKRCLHLRKELGGKINFLFGTTSCFLTS